MATITELFDSKKAINIGLNYETPPSPIKSLIFGKGIPVNSDVLPARYWSKTLKAIPVCAGTTGAEPMNKDVIKLINYDFGSFFAQTDYSAQEEENFIKMSGKSGDAELKRSIVTNGLDSRDLFVENECASSVTGTLSIKTRVNADGTYTTQNIPYGTVSTTVRAGDSWAVAKKSAMYKDLKKLHKAIETQLKRKISKKDIVNLSSDAAFQDLYEICESTQTIDNIKVKYGQSADGYDYIDLQGYKVYDIAADFIDAETQASSTKVADNYIQAIYTGRYAGHGLYYLNIPNKKANFRPLPIISFIVVKETGKGFTQYFESKPVTVFNVAASSKMLVIG